MEQEKKATSRKKFLLWGAGILSSLAAVKLWGLAKKKKETVKMLTQDGKLVEIDKKFLSGQSKKITKEELQGWVKR